ncbi:cupin domain-containing protein [Acidithiobacillus sulfuriphilus]
MVVRGVIKLTVGDKHHLLHPGNAYYFDSSLPPSFRQYWR